MKIDARKKIGDLVREYPSSTGILKKLGIDPYHQGNKTLWDACTNSGISVANAVDQLKQAEGVGRRGHYTTKH